MSDPIAKRTTVVHVGTPPPPSTVAFLYESVGWEMVEVHFNGFEHLPSGRNEMVQSPQFVCHGHKWTLDIYPGGDTTSNDGYVALDIHHRSGPPIEVGLIVNVKNLHGEQIAFCKGQNDFHPRDNAWGSSQLEKRSAVLNLLVGGALIVEVWMKQVGGAVAVPPFIPDNPLCKNVLKRFNEEETSDVVFEVGREKERGRGADDSEGGATKKAKRAAVHFYAHRLFLQDSASTLAELAESAADTSPIQITDVKPEVFRHLLYYVYGGAVAEDEMKDNAKDLIGATDKYGVVGLKLQAEACYAKSVELTVDNVLDNLLYADSKNCALLKEVAVDFIAENGKEVLDKVCFDDVPGALMKDLLAATTRGKEGSNGDESGNDYTTMRVSVLRKKLHEKGLDVDGSREAMIALLKENTPPVEEEQNPEPVGENPEQMEENP